VAEKDLTNIGANTSFLSQSSSIQIATNLLEGSTNDIIKK
jgi:hypothetical protein